MKFIKKIGFIFIIHSFCIFFNAQETHVKGNVLLLPIGLLNVGIEHQLNPKFSLQTDVLISPWKSYMGNHLQYYNGNLEVRYYPKKTFTGWFFGGNIGFAVFDFSKYNYWNKNIYQRGFAFSGGATLGFVKPLKKNWNIEAFFGIGSSQARYHSYIKSTSIARYDSISGWNKSGEIAPLKGGIMLSYTIKNKQ